MENEITPLAEGEVRIKAGDRVTVGDNHIYSGLRGRVKLVAPTVCKVLLMGGQTELVSKEHLRVRERQAWLTVDMIEVLRELADHWTTIANQYVAEAQEAREASRPLTEAEQQNTQQTLNVAETLNAIMGRLS